MTEPFIFAGLPQMTYKNCVTCGQATRGPEQIAQCHECEYKEAHPEEQDLYWTWRRGGSQWMIQAYWPDHAPIPNPGDDVTVHRRDGNESVEVIKEVDGLVYSMDGRGRLRCYVETPTFRRDSEDPRSAQWRRTQTLAQRTKIEEEKLQMTQSNKPQKPAKPASIVDSSDDPSLVPLDDDRPSYRPTMSDEIDTSAEFRPLQVKIMQPSTPEVAANEISPGVWASSLVGELGNSLIIVPLKQGRFRIMNNPTKEFGENEIVCMSPDATHGILNPESDYEFQNMAGRDCDGCPFAKFTKDPKTGRRKAPLCTFNRTYANYLPEHDLIGQITYRRTSHNAGEDMMSIIQQSKGYGHDAFQQTLRLTRQGSYTYYVPIVRRMPVKEEWIEQIAEVKRILGTGVAERMAADAYAEAEADSGATFNPSSGFAGSQEGDFDKQTINPDDVGNVKDVLGL